VTLARYTVVFAVALLMGAGGLVPRAGAATTDHAQAGKKPEKTGKVIKPKETKKEAKKDIKKEVRKDTRKEAGKDLKKDAKKAPHGLPARKVAIRVALPTAPRRASGAVPVTALTPTDKVEVPARPVTPLAPASSSMTSPLDLTAVKQAIALVHKGHGDEASSVEKTIIDPVARKLVEWIILRSDETTVDFSRYAAFIAENPSWPSIITLRYHAEAALWEQQVDPQTVIGYFAVESPLSAKGYFALARAWLVKGDSGRAFAAVRTAWRHTGFSEDLEGQARARFSGLITPADAGGAASRRRQYGDRQGARGRKQQRRRRQGFAGVRTARSAARSGLHIQSDPVLAPHE